MKFMAVNGAGSKRIGYLDALKCLGILLVIRGHIELFGMGICDTYENMSSLMMYSINMPIFFFVSGFLAYKDGCIGNLKELSKLKGKFLYLVVPAVIFAVYDKLYNHDKVALLLVGGFGKYWFTFTLFEAFVLYYLSVVCSRSKIMLISVLTGVSLVGVGYLSFFSKYDIHLWDFNHLAKYFQYFTLGVVAKIYEPFYDRVMQSNTVKTLATIGFFGLLLLLFQDILPSVLHHFCRDIVLRWLGTYIVVSWFYSNRELFERDNRLNKWILKIGQNSLAIYLLQYFFIPDFTAFSEWISGLDICTVHIISLIYSLAIIFICMLFIELLSNSAVIKKYILGKK